MATKNQFSAIATTEDIMHVRDELRKQLQDEVKELVESQERALECIWASQIDTQKRVTELHEIQIAMKKQLNDMSNTLYNLRGSLDARSPVEIPSRSAEIQTDPREEGISNRTIDITMEYGNGGIKLRNRGSSTGWCSFLFEI